MSAPHQMSAPHHRLDARPETADDDPQLATLGTTRVVAIVPDATVDLAARLMASTGVRHLPVMDGPRCVGVVMEADVLRVLAEAGGATVPVGALAWAVPALRPTERRSAAARQMSTAGVDAALIVEDGRLLGIVTATDVVRSVALAGSDRRPGEKATP